jgi:putative salt-induced outer membrane protein YdiY
LRGILFALLTLACAGLTAQADVVTLKNADRVTGTLVNVTGGNLELKSDILGDLKIPLKQVKSFSAEKPVAVIVKGQTPGSAPAAQGQLELEPSGDWQVTENGKPRTITAASVDVIMPAEAYQTQEQAPGLLHAWKGSASLGYAIQRGNQKTNNFTTTINAVRERPATPIFERHWRTTFNLATLDSHSSEDGSFVTSHTLTTSLRQDYLFSPNNFVFGLGELDHVSTEGLYLRQTVGGGYGHDLIKNSRTTFSLLGGLTYVHEKFFTGAEDQSAQLLVGETLAMQLTKRIQLTHDVNFYPNLSYGGQYRFDTSTIIAMKLSNKFSLNTGVIDLYLSNPPAGNEKNNVTFTTGIGYTF